jgi:hypothetical protein
MLLTIENLRVESFVTADLSGDTALASWTRLPTCQPQYTCPECAT